MNHTNPTSSVTHRPLGRWRRSATLLGCALALAGCGGGTELLVVPLFLFGFTDAANQVTVNFTPDQPTTATGTFNTANFNVGPAGTFVPGSGTWSGCTMVLSVPGNPAAPIASGYRGAFTDRNTIRLTPDPAQADRPVLNLSRNDVGVPINPPNCP